MPTSGVVFDLAEGTFKPEPMDKLLDSLSARAYLCPASLSSLADIPYQ